LAGQAAATTHLVRLRRRQVHAVHAMTLDAGCALARDGDEQRAALVLQASTALRATDRAESPGPPGHRWDRCVVLCICRPTRAWCDPRMFPLSEIELALEGRGRHRGRMRRATVMSALVGGAFTAFAVNSAFDGRWRDAREVGVLGLLFVAPAVVAGVRLWRERR
jgi:hypothetical protein